jgi:hypothetical protein
MNHYWISQRSYVAKQIDIALIDPKSMTFLAMNVGYVATNPALLNAG